MRLLFWIFVLIVALVLALFAVSNREMVALGWWPVPFLVEIPLYVAVLAALAVGFLLGELAAWIAGRRRRREARRHARRIASLEGELRATQAQLVGPAERVPSRMAARTSS
jgi:lipopolysaccharide assembly protein A